MKCIVIDDEPLGRKGMGLLIDEIPSLSLEENFGSVVDAGAYLQSNQVDLIFLDIEMPRMNGIDFLRNLINPPMVIFTTAYPQYALEGFELDVVDYLVKPIRFERFFKAITKAQAIYNLSKGNSSGAGMAALAITDDDHVYVRADRKFVKLYLKDINVIEGLKDYSIIHTGGERTVTAMNLKTIENQLPPDTFIRVNKSYIVNKNHISQVDSDVIFVGPRQIPVGERYRQDFFDRVIKDHWIKR
ncbi:MAG: response regulator transcription factor [Bacteroidetes bacterium]|nr:MAG: response regulator transcription factor [Bacteroidota bacterium]